MLLPRFCESDRRDYPCPFAGQQGVVTRVRDELVEVRLPGPVLCEYMREVGSESEKFTDCWLFPAQLERIPHGAADLTGLRRLDTFVVVPGVKKRCQLT